MEDDPVRVLRALRFRAQMGFALDPVLWRELARCAPRCTLSGTARISVNRVMRELAKVVSLGSQRARFAMAMKDLAVLGAMRSLFFPWAPHEAVGTPLLSRLTLVGGDGVRVVRVVWVVRVIVIVIVIVIVAF